MNILSKSPSIIISVFAFFIIGFMLFSPVVVVGVHEEDGGGTVHNPDEDGATVQNPGAEEEEPPIIPNPLKADSLKELFNSIMRVLLVFATPLYVLMILIAGLYFLFSRGDSSKTTKGKNILKYSTIGYIIILAGQALVAIIGNIL